MGKFLILSLLFLGAVFPEPIAVQGSTQEEAIQDGLDQYLNRILFEKSEYSALRQQILARATVYSAQKKLQQEGNRWNGTIALKKMDILQTIVVDVSIRDLLRSQLLYFLFHDDLSGNLKTFFVQYFNIPEQVPSQAQIRMLLAQAKRKELLDLIQPYGLHSGIFIDKDSLFLKAYSFTGRLFASIPIQKTLPEIQESLLESLVQQLILQKDEYCLIFDSTFDRDARKKIFESLKELKIIPFHSTEATELHVDFRYAQDRASLELALRKELKWLDCNAEVELASANYIKFSRSNIKETGSRFNWWLWLAVVTIPGVTVGWLWKWRRFSPFNQASPQNPGQRQPQASSQNPGQALRQAVQQPQALSQSASKPVQPLQASSRNPGQEFKPHRVEFPDLFSGKKWNVSLLNEKVPPSDRAAWQTGHKIILSPGSPNSPLLRSPNSPVSRFLNPPIKLLDYFLVAQFPDDLFGKYFLGLDQEKFPYIIRALPEINPKVPDEKQEEWGEMLKRIEKRGQDEGLKDPLKELQQIIQAPNACIWIEPEQCTWFHGKNGKTCRTLLCVMPYYPGFSLFEWLLYLGKLSWPSAKPILWQTAVILEKLHGKGIVHRDIKPHHILLRLDGACMLTGVALAKKQVDKDDSGENTSAIHLSEEEPVDMTIPGKGLGSPAYVAPEQLKNAVSVDYRADIWSYALLCYHILTGKPLFQGKKESIRAIPKFDNTKGFEDQKIELTNCGIPGPFIEIIRRCLSKKPDKRPSLEEIKKALES